MLADNNKAEALKRLACIEGHLKGIGRMVEEEQCCLDVLKQTYAVRCAIDKVKKLLLQEQINSRIASRIHEGREAEVIGEISQLFELAHR